MKKTSLNSRTICVFCGSSSGNTTGYTALAHDTGQAIHEHGHSLVYGGGGTGLMGTIARSVRDAGGHVFGIIPEFLMKAEHAMEGIDREVVPDMHTRKRRMYDVSDAFIILPGGIGSMEEAIEIICWKRLQIHQKPIIFLSHNGYWDPLLTFIQSTVDAGFSPDWVLEGIVTHNTAKDALDFITQAWAAPIKPRRPLIPPSNI